MKWTADGEALRGRGAVVAGATRGAGRGIAADDRRACSNQWSVTSADMARAYGFTDIDGRQPDGWAGA